MEYHLKPKWVEATVVTDVGLNPAQLEAVEHGEGPLLIVAGAGSGKTKTLVHRVVRLVEQGIRPDHIVLLTFTRKSAQEMVRRAALLGDSRCQSVCGGTFHSFCHTLLRQHAHLLGFKEQVTILDRSDAEDLIAWVRQQEGMVKKDKRFPKKGTLADMFSKVPNLDKSITRILEQDYPQYLAFFSDIEHLYYRYQSTKMTMNMMDYDDLLTHSVALLTQQEDVRQRVQSFYRHILVDEYQDTNAAQCRLMGLLANESHNICAVGDDAQSIYAFRGANVNNILSFPQMFPGTKIVFLEQNYRSTQSVLDLTNAVISQARHKYDKQLYSHNLVGPKPVYLETDSDNMQSRFVCQKILELREEGVSLQEIGVLVRSGWHANDLEIELGLHDIPFVKVGGMRFVETAHIKDLLALLRIIVNPLDAVSWHRILILIEGVGPKSAFSIFSDIQARGSVDRFQDKPYFSTVSDLMRFVGQDFGQKKALWEIVDDAVRWYTPLFQRIYDDFKKRQADLESFVAISHRYSQLDTMLAEMSLDPPDKSQLDCEASQDDEGVMTLSTIHSAKGLEWHTVFILSVVDGYLPSVHAFDDPHQIEEERRLLYVAMTRAKQNLYLIKPHLDASGVQARRSGFYFSKLSRFLTGGSLVEHYMDKWTLVEDRKEPVRLDAIWEDVPPDPRRRKYYF